MAGVRVCLMKDKGVEVSVDDPDRSMEDVAAVVLKIITGLDEALAIETPTGINV